jgi:hypothetical protein
MIKPTVGRVVWFYKSNGAGKFKGPLAAHVAAVQSDQLVNLMVIGASGTNYPRVGVMLVQDGEPVPTADYCTWMPYQVGQAAKTEAAEKAAATAAAGAAPAGAKA